MINKKLLAIAMGALAMGLASCGGNSSEPTVDSSAEPVVSETEPDEGGAVCPVVEGKTAVYFKVAEGSAALPSWASYYATGCWNGWATGAATEANGIVEFQQLGDSNIYYGYMPTFDDATYSADRGFQLAVGYNASAGLSAASSGMNWTYKSASCASWPGEEHPKFEAPVNNEIFLRAHWKDESVEAAHKFESVPPEPIVLKNYSLQFKVSEALKEKLTGEYSYRSLAVKGSFNDWGTTILSYDEKNDVYSVSLGDVIANTTGEMCVSVVNQTGILEDKYNLTKSAEADSKAEGGVRANSVGEDGIFHLGNLVYSPLKFDGNDHVAYWGTLDIPAKQNGSVDKDNVAYVFPGVPEAVKGSFDIVLANSGEGALPEGTVPHYAGMFNGWKHEAFSLGEDGVYHYTVTPTEKAPVYYNVGYEMKVTMGDWDHPQVDDGTGANIVVRLASAMSVPVTVSFDFSKLGVEKTGATVKYGNPMTQDIHINVTSDSAEHVLAEGANLYVAGSWNGWNNAEANIMTKDGDKYVYTIPANTMNIGTALAFGVITNVSWTGKLVGAGLANFSFTIEEGKTNVNIVGNLALCGVKDSEGTLEYVA